MNKKFLSILSLIALMSMSGCNNDTTSSSSNSNTNNSSVNSSSNVTSSGNVSSSNLSSSVNSSTQSSSTSEVIDYNDGKYRVKVLLPNGQPAGAGIQVQWCANGLCHDAETNNNGIATIELEPGEYDVKLYKYSKEYAYQLGLVSTSENRTLEIKLEQILEAKDSSLSDEEVGSPYNPYLIGEGVYNATIKTEGEVVYYGFVPTRPGKYVIESWGTIASLVRANPNVSYYGGNPQYVSDIISSDDDSGYENNFSLEFNIAIDEFYEDIESGEITAGGIYRFGISATDVKSAKTFPFAVKWVDEYVVEKMPAEIINVTEELTLYPEKTEEYEWKTSLLNGLETAIYNEEDGFYHVDSKDGYILTAKISEPCFCLDRPFSKVVEDEEGTKKNEGIVGLTGIVLDNGTKDYTNFVQEYEKYCNSDGVYGVTEELKIFLNYYFLNSKDWIVSSSETVVEDECGWMFACGYYADKADSYTKPWSGTGESEEDAYAVLTGNEYYAKVEAGQSIYYSYFLKNTVNEVNVYFKSDNPNAKFIYNSNEYSSNEGAYVEVALGGLMNPAGIVIEVTTVNGESEGIVFGVGVKEKTVAGDAIALGTNTVEVEDVSFVECKFTAPKDGIYRVVSTETNGWFEFNGNDYKGSEGEINFTAELKKGEILEFKVYTISMTHDYITFELLCDTYAKVGINMASVARNEMIEFTFVAPEAGTYEIECSTTNTAIGYESGFGSDWKYGDSTSADDKKFTFTLNEEQEIILLITTCDGYADKVAFTIKKI